MMSILAHCASADDQDNLTGAPLAATIPALSPHAAVRGESRKNQQMPLARLLHRLRSHMQKIIYGGRYLGSFGSHGSVAMSLNPDNVHRQIFERISGVLKHSTEVITMSQSNSAQNSEQTNPKNIDNLRQAFAHLAFSFDLVNADPDNSKAIGTALDCLESDCEKLALIAEAMRLQARAERERNSATATAQTGHYQTTAPRRMSMSDIIKRQNQERGLEPLPLEPELLLKRVKDGGHSGQFLADAFISAYRTDTPFPHSLGGLIKLDAEGFRLFHQVLHIRHIPGWNDDRLYQIEQQINTIVRGGV